MDPFPVSVAGVVAKARGDFAAEAVGRIEMAGAEVESAAVVESTVAVSDPWKDQLAEAAELEIAVKG
jgi:hypothetical protein